MTESEAVILVAALAAAFPRTLVEQATIDVYAYDLARLDFAMASAAVEKLRTESRWFPTIAEIIEQTAMVQLALPGPAEAFAQAVRGQEKHPLVWRARSLVGDDWTWRTSPEANLRKSFREAYQETMRDAINEISRGELTAPLDRELTR